MSREHSEVKEDRRGWLILLLSVCTAFIIWMLHTLSLNYSVFLEYSVELASSLEGRARKPLSNDVVIIRGKADGYYILAHRLIGREVLSVNVTPKSIIPKDEESDLFSIKSEDLKSGLVEALAGDVELEFIVTESLDFTIPKVLTKRVPVVPRTSIKFNNQYIQTSAMTLKPDSIDVYGEAKLLSTIDSVWTETITYKNVSEPLRGIAEIIPSRWVSYSDKSVFYSMEVSRYVEETIVIPVESYGVPEGKEMVILPSEIEITYRKYFGGKHLSVEDFSFVVDYEEYSRTLGSQVIPRPRVLPKDIIRYEISPRYVDCVVTESK